MTDKQTNQEDFLSIILKDMAQVKTMVQELKDGSTVITEWIPRPKVMEFFGYGDTQMGTLEKSGELVVTKVGNRKFYHRESLLQLLKANVQGESASSTTLSGSKTLKSRNL